MFKQPKIHICVIALLLVCAALSGCGTKGPLYIPERQYPQNNP